MLPAIRGRAMAIRHKARYITVQKEYVKLAPFWPEAKISKINCR